MSMACSEKVQAPLALLRSIISLPLVALSHFPSPSVTHCKCPVSSIGADQARSVAADNVSAVKRIVGLGLS
jgi:hypothetical protein